MTDWVTMHDVPVGERVRLDPLPYDLLIRNTRRDQHEVRAVLGRKTLVVQVDGSTCVTAPVYRDGRAVTCRGGCIAANGTAVTVEVRRLAGAPDRRADAPAVDPATHRATYEP